MFLNSFRVTSLLLVFVASLGCSKTEPPPYTQTPEEKAEAQAAVDEMHRAAFPNGKPADPQPAAN